MKNHESYKIGDEISLIDIASSNAIFGNFQHSAVVGGNLVVITAIHGVDKSTEKQYAENKNTIMVSFYYFKFGAKKHGKKMIDENKMFTLLQGSK